MDYLEIYIRPEIIPNTTNTKNNDRSASFDQETFQEVLKRFKKKIQGQRFASFRKQVMKSFYHTLILEETFDDISTQLIPVKENVYTLLNKEVQNTLYESLATSGIVNYYSKQTKPIHSFPSTTEIYEKTLEDKVIFKINNRLFINFSKTTYKSDPSEKNYYIYFNYNNSDKCDVKMNVNSINEITSIIKNN